MIRSEMYCDNCGNEVAHDASFCSSCGHRVGQAEIDGIEVEAEGKESDSTNDLTPEKEPHQGNERADKEPSKRDQIIGAVVIVVGLVLLIGWLEGDFDSLGSGSTVNEAESILKQRLKSPSSYRRLDAEVAWEGTTRSGSEVSVVMLEYEATNSFGASLKDCTAVGYLDDGTTLRWLNNTIDVCSAPGLISREQTARMFGERLVEWGNENGY